MVVSFMVVSFMQMSFMQVSCMLCRQYPHYAECHYADCRGAKNDRAFKKIFTEQFRTFLKEMLFPVKHFQSSLTFADEGISAASYYLQVAAAQISIVTFI